MTKHTADDLMIARNTTLKLLDYCQKNQWAGYDPYDALNSRVFKALPFLDIKIIRLMLTQGVKRSPLNLRPLLLVPKTPNPKGIALFLSSLIKLSKIGLIEDDNLINTMCKILMSLRSPENRYSCWGYNFDWQTRKKLVPKQSPNIICSTFAANSLLDFYEHSQKASWLEAAVSTAEFILNDLFWRKNRNHACLSYTRLEQEAVHNANLIGAAFLSRVSQLSGLKKFLEPALDAARYSVSKQHEDGSWDYGELPTQRWIDNFHTGYNLVALKKICNYAETAEFEPSIHNGFQFYTDHFFLENGAPKYYHDATYPLDIHSAAQSIITLLEFKDSTDENLALAQSVLNWAMANMWDTDGFFYFWKMPFYTVRTSFMRWSQAWMLLALATLLEEWPSTTAISIT